MNLTPDDRARTARQVDAIVARLRAGPATNADLAAIALKYTGRVSDARKLGHVIRCKRLAGGLTEYRLVAQEVLPWACTACVRYECGALTGAPVGCECSCHARAAA